MSQTFDFESRVVIPPETQAWADLAPELPQYSTLLGATMVLQPTRQFVLLTYLGGNPNGGKHHRKSQQRVSLSITQAEALLAKAYPQSKRAEAFSSVITTSEVDMSQYSPDAQITGFVSSTGKRHLLGEMDPTSTYARTQCSPTFTQGDVTTFIISSLSCQKCRTIAGLPDAPDG